MFMIITEEKSSTLIPIIIEQITIDLLKLQMNCHIISVYKNINLYMEQFAINMNLLIR